MLMERLARKLNAGPNLRTTSGRNFSATFGVPLKEVICRDGTDVPLIVLDIFHILLNSQAFKRKNIFRVNGNSRTVETLRSLIDKNGPNWRVSQHIFEINAPARTVDIFSVASLLKLYLREIPGGLIPTDVTESLVETYIRFRGDRTALFDQITRLLRRLPTDNYTLLQHLCHFLKQVWSFRSENKMSSEALGIVFGPDVFSFDPDTMTIEDQDAANRIMAILIERTEDIFQLPCANNFDSINSGSDAVSVEAQRISCHASDNESEDLLSSDTGSPSRCTKIGQTNFPYSLPAPQLCDVERGSSSVALPFLNEFYRDEFSSGISATIRACIEQHVFSRCDSVNHKLADDSRYVEYVVDYPLHSGESDLNTSHDIYEFNSLLSKHSECEPHTALRDKVSHPQLSSSQANTERFRWCSGSGSAERSEVLSNLSQQLHQIRASIRDCERRFEKEHGHRPSMSEKKADFKMRSLVSNLAEVRASIKKLLSGPQTSEYENSETFTGDVDIYDNKSQLDSTELSVLMCPPAVLRSDPSDTLLTTKNGVSCSAGSPTRNIERKRSLKHSEEDDSTTGVDTLFKNSNDAKSQSTLYNRHQTLPRSAPAHSFRYTPAQSSNISVGMCKPEHTINETLAVLMHRLEEKRCSSKRPECLQHMTRKQIEDEKLDLQKALLYFERLHGRPSGKQERLIMRPLYDRYRTVKRMLNPDSQLDKTSVSAEISKIPHCDNWHVVSSEGDSGQTEKPFDFVNSSHSRVLAPDRPMKSFTIPRALATTNESRDALFNDLVSRGHCTQIKDEFVRSNFESKSYQSNKPGMCGIEIEINNDDFESQSKDPRATHENWSSGNGDAAQLNTSDNHTNRGITGLDYNNARDQNSMSRSVHSSPLDVNTNDHGRKAGTGSNALAGTSPTAISHSHSRKASTTLENNREIKISTVKLSSGEKICTRQGELSRCNDDDPTEWPISRLKSEVNMIRESKRQLQKILKDFEHDFEQNMGHKVERGDRSCMRGEYNRYKFLKSRLLLLETELRNRVD